MDGTPDKTTGYLVSDLVGMALRQIGVGAMGTTASGPDTADGIMHLNMMLAQWQRRRWIVPNLIDLFCTSTGASHYNVGPGQAFDMPVRTDKIESAYARILLNGGTPSTAGDFDDGDFNRDFLLGSNGLENGQNPIDFPLTIIQSYEDYSGIGLKGLRAWPIYAYYDPAYPYGRFMPWPIPPAEMWELHILVKQPLLTNLAPDSIINLPPEYWDALMWCLAARMAPSYGQEASPTVVACAKSAMNTIRTANTQIPTLGMPAALTPSNGGFWWPGLEIQRL
ncbi:hypothetical protein [Acetobacter cerevisiae]|uniref:Uncharacterized protein n=1 Tax=Acetobacter cerevisiae TaxID=178900 RepID=A0A149Q7U3_9PROT|nr:hypothetical protein [Acetobacter cerevisiae]KXU93313.1 hypothetical protein AD928_09055 [Acetobacter cerevisiae]GBQ10357.1 hypothetical protein AA14362_2526 [Acetobacter cerevisiae DSM 14362]